MTSEPLCAWPGCGRDEHSIYHDEHFQGRHNFVPPDAQQPDRPASSSDLAWRSSDGVIWRAARAAALEEAAKIAEVDGHRHAGECEKCGLDPNQCCGWNIAAAIRQRAKDKS